MATIDESITGRSGVGERTRRWQPESAHVDLDAPQRPIRRRHNRGGWTANTTSSPPPCTHPRCSSVGASKACQGHASSSTPTCTGHASSSAIQVKIHWCALLPVVVFLSCEWKLVVRLQIWVLVHLILGSLVPLASQVQSATRWQHRVQI